MRYILIITLVSSWFHVYWNGIPLYGFVFYPVYATLLILKPSRFDVPFVLSFLALLGITLAQGRPDLGAVEMYLFVGANMSLYEKIPNDLLHQLKRWHMWVLPCLLLTVPLQFLGIDVNQLGIVQSVDNTTWMRSANNFRSTGLFGSPFEAGVAFALYFFIALRSSVDWKSILLFFCGVFTLSKAFLISIPIVSYVARNRMGWRAPLLGLFFATLGWTFLLSDWQGIGALNKLFDLSGDSGDLVRRFTANRFGGDSNTVQSRLTLTGFFAPKGFQTPQYPLDSLILYIVHTLGIFCLPVIWTFFGALYRSSKPVFLFIILASLGGPVIFKNYLVQILVLHWYASSDENNH